MCVVLSSLTDSVRLIEKLVALENASSIVECVFTRNADDRDWPMGFGCRHKCCLVLYSIVSLTDLG